MRGAGMLTKPEIVSYISKYVPLARKGNKLWGKCPFHNETLPSLVVSPEKQVFHCFGCKEGGDVISFIEKYHHVDFNGALDIIGHKRPVTKRERRAAARDIRREQKERKQRHLNEMQRVVQSRLNFQRIAHLDYMITLTRDTMKICRDMDDLEDISSAIHMLPEWEYELETLLYGNR
jgi:DNA primase